MHLRKKGRFCGAVRGPTAQCGQYCASTDANANSSSKCGTHLVGDYVENTSQTATSECSQTRPAILPRFRILGDVLLLILVELLHGQVVGGLGPGHILLQFLD